MKKPGPRVIGFLVCTTLAGGGWAYLRLHSPYAAYKSDFDQYVLRQFPRLSGVLRANPVLRQEINAKQRLAFDHSGRVTASAMFWNIVDSRLLAAAGDDAVRACGNAYSDLYRALAGESHLCREMIVGQLSRIDNGPGAAALARKNDRCDTAMEDGARHQEARPPYVYGDAYDAAVSRAMAGPVAFTDADRAAYADPDSASDADVCAEEMKFLSNEAKLPPVEYAGLIRAAYVTRSNFAVLDAQPPAHPTRADDLQCAAPGTRFVLTTFLQDGRPNVWTSLGRHGFDCALDSAAVGKRGAFGTLYSDLSEATTPNPLRLLWPLTVGTSISLTYVPVDGTPERQLDRVASRKRYWMPWGDVEAFELEQDVWRARDHYVLTYYWAPALGFTIGRATRAITGRVPEDIGHDYDFQVIAVVPPR